MNLLKSVFSNKSSGDVKFRQVFTLEELDKSYPPKFMNSHKSMIYQMLPPLSPEMLQETVAVSRWQCINFPNLFPVEHKIEHEMFEDAFSYTPGPVENTEWYVNFADSRLFGFFEGSLFAQDEMQVMEHPCLGSVRNALSKISEKDKGARPFTRGDGGQSTPILIKGAKRRVSVATDRNEAAGRPAGLYGNQFAKGSSDAVRAACTFINPPTTTNIIAIEAPKGGRGIYTRAQIKDAFDTAFTGFFAAKVESKVASAQTKVVVHTGNWGGGAFGGNRILMATIQLLAAHVAEVDKLVFHTFEPSATDAYKKGKALYEELAGSQASVQSMLDALVKKEFAWGVSDGN